MGNLGLLLLRRKIRLQRAPFTLASNSLSCSKELPVKLSELASECSVNKFALLVMVMVLPQFC
jgi:hypothetical protein